MKPLFFFLLLSFSFISLKAQNPERCGTDSLHALLMQDSAYAAAYHDRMDKMARYLKEHKDITKAECDELLYLPVAVHFEGVDIDMACAIQMALSQVDRLNADYSGQNIDVSKFTNNQATWPGTQNKESCVRFCLATLT